MQDVLLDYGDSRMKVELPDTATVVRFGQSYQDPPAVDPVEATRNALRNPLGTPPLREMGGPNKKVVIGFPDRVKGGSQKNSHRKTAIPLIIEELLAGGTKLENITLLCCMGLHRQNTLAEWYDYLGHEIVDQFWPDRIINHDAEAPDLLDFGVDGMGNAVQCNRMMAEADLPIVVGHCAGNPYGGYSGGYKMVVTGMTGMKSIASHHAPKTMHRDDWLGASPKQHMRHQFRAIGEAMEAGMGKRFFGVDAVLGQKSQVLGVAAGTLAEVEKATWPLAKERTNVFLDMEEKADVLVIGLPRNFHYGPGMGTNPILMSLAIGGQLSRSWGAFREGGVIIAASMCDGWFNPDWFPSYEPTYELLQKYNSAPEFLASDDARTISQDPGYIYKYRTAFTYHPFHAMSMISGGSVPANRTSAVFIVGAKAPRYARGMGFKPVSTFEEALRQAERYVGKNPRVLCTPEAFSGGTAVHLQLKNGA
ncbi:lactate racemase domain-containing protein [Consotaella salsifontis]|uniref:Nickel-dependent lactate racemase n=1 Tax=Consotaella salsifontis TaxID=1365950 RepID=A0A1T4TG00_9HYPH|nr:lactate racemase domain-containing protein [Consotaella salsifontis]SKA39367.1 Nickel-dependent lactate racemase [Consotaella salsifontis]